MDPRRFDPTGFDPTGFDPSGFDLGPTGTEGGHWEFSHVQATVGIANWDQPLQPYLPSAEARK
ncbi:hypothetical protein GGI08_003459 [Coemansia sp. S2]|nr:hypothetical protein GGI08_003459 [Coemansia sp. S2]